MPGVSRNALFHLRAGDVIGFWRLLERTGAVSSMGVGPSVPRPPDLYENEREFDPDETYLRVRAALARLNRSWELQPRGRVCSIQRLSDEEIEELAGWLDKDSNRVDPDHKEEFKDKAQEYADRADALHRQWMVWVWGEKTVQKLERDVPEDVFDLAPSATLQTWTPTPPLLSPRGSRRHLHTRPLRRGTARSLSGCLHLRGRRCCICYVCGS
ncbi:unnamed protein product [Vitrella brassicaformis CCMP3155]|uniref:Uncharacterized protein n=1 Tax=Vitrella brassicaformis (strain CCMP3155) TaxID=1169540 RepID=A0A0G4EV34_VITBC|nr:unnamed protein product [Vitrella brassicaformis CCMP3155]|eukprot:CEM02197.1 unnamed protein product [Vitrella brassicaformis CCMP3155]